MTTYIILCSGEAIIGPIPGGPSGPIMSVTTSTSNLPSALQVVPGGLDFITNGSEVICNISTPSESEYEVSGSFQYSGINVTGVVGLFTINFFVTGINTFPGNEGGGVVNWPISSSSPLSALLTFPLQTVITPPVDEGMSSITFSWSFVPVTDILGTFNIDLTITV